MNLDILKFFILLFTFSAIYYDLISRQVTNRHLLLGLSFLLLVSFISRDGSVFISGLGGFAITLGVGFMLWRLRVLGGADVKMMAVMAISLPWDRSLEFMFYSLAWGSVLGVVALALDKGLVQESRILNFHPLMTIRSPRVKNHKIPFTVAILFGILSTWVLESKGVYFL